MQHLVGLKQLGPVFKLERVQKLHMLIQNYADGIAPNWIVLNRDTDMRQRVNKIISW